MKNLIVLLVLFSFVLVPFNTNAWNIDYSKTQIKVSWKNYTLTKVKDLLYKNITNKVNQKQTESLKIDSYNSFIKTLDKIIIQSKKSSKTQNIHLWYMIEDLKVLLNNDLEKITNKTNQIENKKEVLENTGIEWVKIDENSSISSWEVNISKDFVIKTSFDRKISKWILSDSNKIIYQKYISIASKIYYSWWKITNLTDLSSLVDNSENKFVSWIDYAKINSQRAETSWNWKASLTSINISFTVDWMWIEITEYYSNDRNFSYWYGWMWFTDVKSAIERNWEYKASVGKVNWEKPWQNFWQ